jgi:hypothetical protein
MARKPKADPNRPPRKEAAAEAAEPATAPSGTAVAAEAMRTGVVPLAATPANRTDTANRGDARLKAGDADSDALQNAMVGDETPGGSQLTPDQDRVDDIGRAVGVQEADSGELRTSGEILDARDRRRAQQDVPDPTTRE